MRLLIENSVELTASSVRLYSAKPLEELLVPDKSELRRFIAQNIVRRRPKKPVLKLIPTFAVFMLLIENQAFNDSILLHLFEEHLKTLNNVVDNKYAQKYEVSMVSEEASLELERPEPANHSRKPSQSILGTPTNPQKSNQSTELIHKVVPLPLVTSAIQMRKETPSAVQ